MRSGLTGVGSSVPGRHQMQQVGLPPVGDGGRT
jgi:hypothetical protein